MSMPKIPDIRPKIDIDRKKSIDLLLAAIAFEELALAHIINAEAEEIQFVLGTLHEKGHHKPKDIKLEELLKLNKSVESVLRKVITKEILLGFQLEDILELAEDIDDSHKDDEDCEDEEKEEGDE